MKDTKLTQAVATHMMMFGVLVDETEPLVRRCANAVLTGRVPLPDAVKRIKDDVYNEFKAHIPKVPDTDDARERHTGRLYAVLAEYALLCVDWESVTEQIIVNAMTTYTIMDCCGKSQIGDD